MTASATVSTITNATVIATTAPSPKVTAKTITNPKPVHEP
jgi:hypothetical protein